MALKDRLREARKKAGLSQEQLASMIGVAKSTLSGYERDGREPTMNTLSKIMNALGVDANYLLQDEMKELEETANLNLDERNTIKKIRKLDTHGKRIVTMVIDEEYSRCVTEEESRVVEFLFDSNSGEYVARRKTEITQDMAKKMIERLQDLGEQ